MISISYLDSINKLPSDTQSGCLGKIFQEVSDPDLPVQVYTGADFNNINFVWRFSFIIKGCYMQPV